MSMWVNLTSLQESHGTELRAVCRCTKCLDTPNVPVSEVSCVRLNVTRIPALPEHVMVWIDRAKLCSCGCNIVTLYPAADAPEGSPTRWTNSAYCRYCRNVDDRNDMVETYDNGDWGYACNSCHESRYADCYECESSYLHTELYSVYSDGIARQVCYDCRSSNYVQCEECADYRHIDDERCCTSPDACGCDVCRIPTNRLDDVIHYYSHKPYPDFKRIGHELKYGVDRYNRRVEKTLYMGFELEVSVRSPHGKLNAANAVQGELGQAVYLKEDSSIGHGFEIVSHPGTLEYWMASFNWDALRKFRQTKLLGSPDTCGLHIHVSKAAFQNANHEYRWLLFWFRNQDAITALAGRGSNHYATFDTANRAQFKGIVKGDPSPDRYSAINSQNEATHEVRIFASTLYVNRLKAALQLVESTVEYTRHLVASKIMHDGGFCWSEFVAYLRTNPDRYRHLLGRIRDVVKVRDRVVSVLNTTVRNPDPYADRRWIDKTLTVVKQDSLLAKKGN